MKKDNLFYTYVILALTATLAVSSGCSKKKPTEPAQTSEAIYVGSALCGHCHDDIYASFLTTGHPYKLNKMSNGILPTYPDESPGLGGAGTPPNFPWTNVTYVIGGYGWKARFLGTDGYIITAGGQNQFNLADSTWTDYHRDEQKPYDCGPCHMTGYDGSGHQDGLPGIVGTWAYPGVQCEQCHGPGSKHAVAPHGVDMTVDLSSYSCGQCHVRDDPNKIPASGGFIRHHEQYNEMLATKKAHFNCVECHDPHKRAHWDPNGILVSCETCHPGQQVQQGLGMDALQCVDCHMPYATKSARSLAEYQGDVRTHLFRINTDSLAQMFDSTGSYANGYLTLEYSCMYASCHDGDTKSYLSSVSGLIH